jgi:hypothetical protein
MYKATLTIDQYRKLTEQQELQLPKEFSDRIQALKGLPFWIIPKDLEPSDFDLNTFYQSKKMKESFAQHAQLYDKYHNTQFDNSYCCFNHALGLPRKHGKPNPMYEYELMMYYYMFMHKWVDTDPDTGTTQDMVGYKRLAWLKARGLGGSEAHIRLMPWMCLRDDNIRGSTMAVIVGPRIFLAVDILNRMKNLFYLKLGISFPYNSLTLWLNRVKINAYPSHKIQAFRGQENVSFIFFDEADFAPRNQQFEILSVAEGYIPKSNPYMSFLSTPNEVNGLMQTLELEHDELGDQAIFKFLRTDYLWGLGRVYSPFDIRVLQKNANVFAREMRLQYGVGSGAIFTKEVLDMLARYGEMFKPTVIDSMTEKVMSVDPGYGDSYFAISVWEYMPETRNVRCIFGERYANLTYDEGLNKCEENIDLYNPVVVYVDASQRGFINALKDRIGEDHSKEKEEQIDYQLNAQRKEVIKRGGTFKRVKYLEDFMRIVPFAYTNKKEILSHMKTMCEIEGMVCIDTEQFPDLYLEYQTARMLNNMLVKNKEAPMDLFESSMQALYYWAWD